MPHVDHFVSLPIRDQHCFRQMAFITYIVSAALEAVTASGLQSVNQLFHTFPATDHGAGGITATVLLAESHLCVHTWPKQKAVTLDVYVCNFGGNQSAKARALLQALVERFAPEWTEQRSLDRGGES